MRRKAAVRSLVHAERRLDELPTVLVERRLPIVDELG